MLLAAKIYLPFFLRKKILISKKDVAAAFKWLWLAIRDAFMFATDIPGAEFGLDKVIGPSIWS